MQIGIVLLNLYSSGWLTIMIDPLQKFYGSVITIYMCLMCNALVNKVGHVGNVNATYFPPDILNVIPFLLYI